MMIRRVSKDDARRILGVSDSTIDRRIQRGELSTERDGRRVWVVLDDEVLGVSADASPETTPETTPEAARKVNGASADAAEMLQVRLLEERVRSQDELIAMYKTQNSGLGAEVLRTPGGARRGAPDCREPQPDPAGRSANPGPPPVDVLEAGPLSAINGG